MLYRQCRRGVLAATLAILVLAAPAAAADRALYQVEGDLLRYSTLVAPASLADAKVVTGTTSWKRQPKSSGK